MPKAGLLRNFSVVLAGLLFIQVAKASDPAQLVGKWVEKFPNGATMNWEFTPTSISLYPADPSGKPGNETNAQNVTYRDLGDSIAIEFKGGGGIMAMIKDQQSMVLIFPGMGSRRLIRMQPQ